MADFQKSFAKLMQLEGGMSNNPADKGGLTKYGISQAAYPELDIEKITIDDAKAIYQKDYWQPLELDQEPEQTKADILFHTAVNCGLSSTRHLLSLVKSQLSLGENFLIQWKLLLVLRYISIVNKNPSQKVFLLGWLNRIFHP